MLKIAKVVGGGSGVVGHPVAYNVLKIFSNRVLWIRIVTNFTLSVLVLGMVVVVIA